MKHMHILSVTKDEM